jgi:CRISPR-associated protein Cas2
MFYVVSYDIPDDRRRVRVAKTLLDFGTRVQFSVFECCLEPNDIAELVERLEKGICIEEDRIRIYGLCAGCVKDVRLLGEGHLTEDPELYIA